MKASSYTSTRLFDPQHNQDDRLYYEKTVSSHGFSTVAGVDEAGRGPLAGPVVAGCVVLSHDHETDNFKDSKVLSSSQRKELFALLMASDHFFGVGIAEIEEIERINIHQASLLAMKRAIHECNRKITTDQIDFLLVDGRAEVPMAVAQQPLIKGESKSCSIAAASIIAKVTRDKLMAEYHQTYPHYNFLKNQGYPTAEHRKAIKQFGPCPIHRKTYKGVREYYQHHPVPGQKIQSTLW